MASLVKRPDGNYGLIWTDRSRDKPQTREALRTDNRKQARTRQRILESLYDYNQHHPWMLKWYRNPRIKDIVQSGDLSKIEKFKKQTAISLFEAAEEYIQYKTDTPGEWDSPNTVSRYSNKIRYFASFTGLDIPFSEVTDKHVIAFTKRGKLKDFTIQSDIRRINTFFDWGIDKGYRTEALGVSGPNPQKDIPDFLYNDELKRACLYKIDKEIEGIKYGGYLKESHCQWWVPLFWILLSRTGMRPSELIAVRLPHISEHEILVRAGSKGKSKAAKRRVPILGQVVRQVLDVLTDPDVRSRDACMSGSDYLFGRASHASQKRASAEFTEAIYVRIPGKRNFKMRDLRNTFAYWMLTMPGRESAEFRSYKLKRILGHATSDMSEYYLDTLPYNPDLERLHLW